MPGSRAHLKAQGIDEKRHPKIAEKGQGRPCQRAHCTEQHSCEEHARDAQFDSRTEIEPMANPRAQARESTTSAPETDSGLNRFLSQAIESLSPVVIRAFGVLHCMIKTFYANEVQHGVTTADDPLAGPEAGGSRERGRRTQAIVVGRHRMQKYRFLRPTSPSAIACFSFMMADGFCRTPRVPVGHFSMASG